MRGVLIFLGLVLCAVLGYTAVRLTGSGVSDTGARAERDGPKRASKRSDLPSSRVSTSSPEQRQPGSMSRRIELGNAAAASDGPPPEPELVPGPLPTDPGVPSPEAKLAHFKGALERIDEELSRSYEPNAQRKAQLYQDLSESFQALSVHLNANDPEQLDYLEFARKELLERMQALDVDAVRVGDAQPKRGEPRLPSPR